MHARGPISKWIIRANRDRKLRESWDPPEAKNPKSVSCNQSTSKDTDSTDES